jgi:hypothetical protein
MNVKESETSSQRKLIRNKMEIINAFSKADWFFIGVFWAIICIAPLDK